MISQQFLSVAAGKRLIAKALAGREDVQTAVKEHTVVLIKGSTNALLAEELLRLCGQEETIRGFYRGVFHPSESTAKYPVMPGDLVIRKGEVIWNKTIFDVVEDLQEGDMIFKGANAVNPLTHEAAILIGNPTGGTMVPLTQAVIGKRVTLIHPAGLEKRNRNNLHAMAELCNASGTDGLRMMVSPGRAYTEMDAFRDLFGIEPTLAGAGGVAGYEGGCFFLLKADETTLQHAMAVLHEIADEPRFEL